MKSKTDKEIFVEADVLAGYFLTLLQRDGVISNNTYLAANKMLKEGYDVHSDKVHKRGN